MEATTKTKKIVVEDEALETALSVKLDIAAAEEERRKGIEAKGGLLLSTISVASSIVVAANVLITVNKDITLQIKISVLLAQGATQKALTDFIGDKEKRNSKFAISATINALGHFNNPNSSDYKDYSGALILGMGFLI